MKNYLNYIELNSRKVVGKPVIKGTRITVELILRLLTQGVTFDEIMKTYPHIKKEHIFACLQYATQILESEKIFPVKHVQRDKALIGQK